MNVIWPKPRTHVVRCDTRIFNIPSRYYIILIYVSNTFIHLFVDDIEKVVTEHANQY